MERRRLTSIRSQKPPPRLPRPHSPAVCIQPTRHHTCPNPRPRPVDNASTVCHSAIYPTCSSTHTLITVPQLANGIGVLSNEPAVLLPSLAAPTCLSFWPHNNVRASVSAKICTSCADHCSTPCQPTPPCLHFQVLVSSVCPPAAAHWRQSNALTRWAVRRIFVHNNSHRTPRRQDMSDDVLTFSGPNPS